MKAGLTKLRKNIYFTTAQCFSSSAANYFVHQRQSWSKWSCQRKPVVDAEKTNGRKKKYHDLKEKSILLEFVTENLFPHIRCFHVPLLNVQKCIGIAAGGFRSPYSKRICKSCNHKRRMHLFRMHEKIAFSN